MLRSDDFVKPAFGTRWTFYGADPDEEHRADIADNALVLRGKGTGLTIARP